MTSANQLPIIDGHNDTLLNLYMPDRGKGRSFFEQSEIGHIDLPRARAGGFGGGFFALFVPSSQEGENPPDADPATVAMRGGPATAPPVDQAHALQFTVGMMASLLRLEAEADGQVKVVRTADELTQCLDDGTLAIILHIEGAEAIDPDLDALHVFHAAGLRSLGITWSRDNAFGHGVPFRFPSSPDIGPGLTEAGQNLVRTCNELGILLDLSHLNEKGFWDVAKLSTAPLVATHSGVHALCPVTRNLTDKQIDAIGESDGMIGINFHVGFLREDGQSNADTPLERIAEHADYIVERIGVDHVGLGSDFDGATVPAALGDVAGLPKLIETFRARGYDSAALRKLAYENWGRVLHATWR
jgi:membrane dipeptidase